jgi:hypothetical protein
VVRRSIGRIDCRRARATDGGGADADHGSDVRAQRERGWCRSALLRDAQGQAAARQRVTIVSSVGIGYGETGKAINAKTGRSFRYWSFSGGPGPEEPSELLEAVQINARGQLACVVGVAPTPKEGFVTRKVFGVEPTGKRQTLDSDPSAQILPSSLKLSGSTVQWTEAGLARNASL